MTMIPEARNATLSPRRLQDLVASGECLVLDVRTPGEFDSIRIRESRNVPLDRIERVRSLEGLVEEGLPLTSDSTLVLVCRSGARATKAAEALRAEGIPEPLVLEGGIVAWEREGLDVHRGEPRWSLERQVRFVAGLLVLAGVLGGAFLWPPLVWFSALIGAGLTFAAVTDTCTMGMLLSKLPYNRPRS